MNSIREIGYTLCVIMVVTGIFFILLPSGNMLKTAKFSVNLFLIISVITPFFNNKINFSSVYDYEARQSIVYEDLTKLYNSQIIESFENELENKIKAVFLKYDIVPKKTEIFTNVKTDKCIDITEIEITLMASDRLKCDKAVKEINEMFNLVVKINFV